MLSRKGSRSGIAISAVAMGCYGSRPGRSPADLELLLEPLAEFLGVEEQAGVVRGGEDRGPQVVRREQGKEVDEQVVERDRARDGPLPGPAGAGLGEGGVRPEGEGVVLAPHHPAVIVLEAPGLLPVGDQLKEIHRAVGGRERQELTDLVLLERPDHGSGSSAPTGTAAGSSPAGSAVTPSSARSSPRIQSARVSRSSASSSMPALSQRLTTLRKKQEASSSGSSVAFCPKRWPPKVMPRRMKLTLARAIGDPSSMQRSRTAFEVRVRK